MTDGLFLSAKDNRPMYLQIMEQIKAKVVAGDWPPGSPLPSIRELAASTKVSVITVKRAYTELDREGIILTVHGKGSFVADSANLQADIQREKLDEHIHAAGEVAKTLGMSRHELIIRVNEILDLEDM